MIVDDPESLHKWLMAVLKPLCDADPDALAKYVFALLRKDLPIPGLKKCMAKQLEVFLDKKTDSFVNKLFTAVVTRTYGPNDTSLDSVISTEKTDTSNSVPSNLLSANKAEASKKVSSKKVGSKSAATTSTVTKPSLSTKSSVLTKPATDCEVSSTSKRDIQLVTSAKAKDGSDTTPNSSDAGDKKKPSETQCIKSSPSQKSSIREKDSSNSSKVAEKSTKPVGRKNVFGSSATYSSGETSTSFKKKKSDINSTKKQRVIRLKQNEELQPGPSNTSVQQYSKLDSPASNTSHSITRPQSKPCSPRTNTSSVEINDLSPHAARLGRKRLSRSPSYNSKRSPLSPRPLLRARTHSRSPFHFIRSRTRSRSRGRRSRSSDRSKGRAPSRSKMSPLYKYDSNIRQSRSRSRSVGKRHSVASSRSRSPLFTRNYRRCSPQNSSGSWSTSRSRTRSRSLSHSWSRSRSPLSRSRSRSHSKSRSLRRRLSRDTATPTQDSNHGDIDMRLNLTSQSIKCAVGIDASVSTGNSASKDHVTSLPASVPLPVPPVSTPSFNSLSVPPVLTNEMSVENLPPNINSGIMGSSLFGTGVERRCRDFDEMGYCMRGDMCPFDHGIDPVVLEDVGIVPTRILNFGVPAPIAPQLNTNVLPSVIRGLDMSIPPPRHNLNTTATVSNILSQQLTSTVGGPTEEYNPDSPGITSLSWPAQFAMSGKQDACSSESVGTAAIYNLQTQRELINVPVVNESMSNIDMRVNLRHLSSGQSEDSHDGKKRKFDYSRLGPAKYKSSVNCSLELKKIPRSLNNIFHLNNHFSRFGKIVNIQISPDNDPEAAIITFSSHLEANSAYRSTEAVLNNRFIKVFWHLSSNTANSIDSIKSSSEIPGDNLLSTRIPVKERLGATSSALTSLPLSQHENSDTENVPTVPVSSYISSTYIPTNISQLETELSSPKSTSNTLSTSPSSNPSSVLVKPIHSVALSNESMTGITADLKTKDVLLISLDLRRRQQQLLEKLVEEQKLLVSKIEKKECATLEQRSGIISAIEKLQKHIDKIRQDLKAPFPVREKSSLWSEFYHSVNICNRKTREEIKREILDAELDLLTKQKDSVDATDTKKKLEDLKTHALFPGAVTMPFSQGNYNNTFTANQGGRGASWSTPVYRGRGRGSTHVSVDHRTTKILVSGYEIEEKADVISHFEQFGEIVDYVSDDSTPSLIMTFKSRKEAEAAVANGCNFQDRNLFINWCSNSSVRGTRGCHAQPVCTQVLPTQVEPTIPKFSVPDILSEEELLGAEDDIYDAIKDYDVSLEVEEALLNDDDDEDTEGRSWRH